MASATSTTTSETIPRLDCYQQALNLFSDLGDRYKEAGTRTSLGDTHHANGSTSAARQCWQQALAILADLGHPDADTVRARLSEPQH